MMLEGRTRGEVHGWESNRWCDSFEVASFLDQRSEEWGVAARSDNTMARMSRL